MVIDAPRAMSNMPRLTSCCLVTQVTMPAHWERILQQLQRTTVLQQLQRTTVDMKSIEERLEGLHQAMKQLQKVGFRDGWGRCG